MAEGSLVCAWSLPLVAGVLSRQDPIVARNLEWGGVSGWSPLLEEVRQWLEAYGPACAACLCADTHRQAAGRQALLNSDS